MKYSLATHIERIKSAIRDAAIPDGRDQDSVTPVAAAKAVATAGIQAAIDLEVCAFRKNGMQEVASMWPVLRATYPRLTLHMIGPMQSNKACQVNVLLDVIGAVDHAKLAQTFEEETKKQGRNLPVNIQGNISNAPQESGVLSADAPSLIAACRNNVYPLNVQGLNCISPVGQGSSSYFSLRRSMVADHSLPILSMGMSSGFPQGIEHGATHIGVGSEIFGACSPVAR